jgi:D-alanyl-lipoteichoic acid acyltransferase DltB (MBOAT superfamily)
MPQFCSKRTFKFDNAIDGMRQILWGLFKKIVIADNCAIAVNTIFSNYSHYSGSTLLLGSLFFAFQIYADFSGYSDIAIGTARLFDIKLMRNFAFPYFSRDIAEFWRRWHISLSTWFRDYVYIPLGGSRCSTFLKIRNVFVIFIISGFWHGANWTFIVWGALNALYFLPIMLLNKNRKYTDTVAEGKILPNLKEVFEIGTTFFMTLIAWVIFRAESVYQAVHYIGTIFSLSLFSAPDVFPIDTFVLIMLFVLSEWVQRNKQHVLQFDKGTVPGLVQWGIYYVIISVIIYFGGNEQQFIYFQF